ncbi:MAG: winged helix-turn-helix domain-containing protein [Alcanivoracaceae bacterium]|nr:winged helix-turn-helix domain-containing protein [Alcanivoracaceae bacterium]
MTKQYWIGGFYIDLSRNQITQNKQSQTIAPKAMAVLNYLAENQGKVVSHDALLDKVWQGIVVSPNTLQRSIAQLRKALGDDGKVQVYIKTHTKQGYSLECDVRWHDSIEATQSNNLQENTIDGSLVNEANKDTGITNKPQASKASLKLISIVAGIIILAIIGYKSLSPYQTSPLTFDTLRSLTATDDKEFDATYSPDGQYIVFHRYLDNRCGNKLWAKNINTQEEIQLTKNWGAYGSHSFSKDGKKLVFIETYECSEPTTQKDCYDLQSLDFEKALESPQQPSVLLQCENSYVKKPIWLSNDNIAIMQDTSNRWKLINYSISKNESTDLYALRDGYLIDYAYLVNDDIIAVTRLHSDGQQYIEMLKPDGRIISSHPIEFPREISKSRFIHPTFDPLNKQLIFSTGKQLFTLSYEGKIAKISLPFSDIMIPTEFHPDGNRLLLIKGLYDNDIVLLSLNQITETPLVTQIEQAQLTQPQTYPYPSFERSNLGESDAMFQPDGDLIAFLSSRSGEKQLWISDGNNTAQQLTQLPTDSNISGIDWAKDGKSLLVNANGILTQVFLDSSQQPFSLQHTVIRLYQWDSENNTALLRARIEGIAKFVEYDLNNYEYRELSDKKILWALKSEDGQLIYKDYMGRFWQPGPAEAQHIKAINNQGEKAKSFVINGNVIYAINSENFVWSYDLDNESFKILGEVINDIDNLTDINDTQLLMTLRVSEKKEVVELSLSE